VIVKISPAISYFTQQPNQNKISRVEKARADLKKKHFQ
jgi:hypothetical protein